MSSGPTRADTSARRGRPPGGEPNACYGEGGRIRRAAGPQQLSTDLTSGIAFELLAATLAGMPVPDVSDRHGRAHDRVLGPWPSESSSFPDAGQPGPRLGDRRVRVDVNWVVETEGGGHGMSGKRAPHPGADDQMAGDHPLAAGVGELTQRVLVPGGQRNLVARVVTEQRVWPATLVRPVQPVVHADSFRRPEHPALTGADGGIPARLWTSAGPRAGDAGRLRQISGSLPEPGLLQQGVEGHWRGGEYRPAERRRLRPGGGVDGQRRQVVHPDGEPAGGDGGVRLADVRDGDVPALRPLQHGLRPVSY